MTRAEARALAAEALRLRAWALRVMATPRRGAGTEREAAPSGGTAPGAGTHLLGAMLRAGMRPPQDVSARGWQLFLHAERCALPLNRLLRTLGGEVELPSDVAHIIDALALEETRRILSARAQMKRISRWAEECGETAVVLKGAVAALDERCGVDLSDIDVWVTPDAQAALLERLGEDGHVPKAGEAAHHHAARLAEQLVAVEVHREVPHADLDADWTARVQPLHETMPGIACLDAADHLWHVLVHATVQHAERRGRLRDLLLIEHALARCSTAQREVVLGRARRSRYADPLLAMLEMAGRIGSGKPPRDAFAKFAAAAYLQRVAAPPPALAPLNRFGATGAVLGGARACIEYLAQPFRCWTVPPGKPVLRQVLLRGGWLGRGIVFSLRMAYRVATIAFALHTARGARRLTRVCGAAGPNASV